MHKILRMIREDGSVVEVPYRRTGADKQRKAVAWFLIQNGHRPSEAAMTVASMNQDKLRSMYQALVLLGKVKQDEEPTAERSSHE